MQCRIVALNWYNRLEKGGIGLKPIMQYFQHSSDPEACRRAYVLGYRAGYQDGRSGSADITRTYGDAEGVLSEPIEAMKLSTHAYNCLLRAGCRYVGDVVNLPESQIIRIRNMGKVTAAEIRKALKEYGITDTDWDFAWRPE